MSFRGSGDGPPRGDTCPHGVPKGEYCKQCVAEYGQESTNVANEIVFGKAHPKMSEVLPQLDELRKKKEGMKGPDAREGGVPDYLEATMHHSESNDIFNGFAVHVNKVLQGKSVTELSREEVAELYSSWSEMGAYEEAENKALEAYERTEKEGFAITDMGRGGNHSLTTVNSRMQALDIKWRKAVRIEDKKERDAEMDRLDAELGEDMKHIDERNLRAEYQLMAIVRKRARMKGLEHIVNMEHSLPRNDLNDKYKEDSTLYILGNQITIQQKTEALSDSSRTEFNERKAAEERDKIAKISNTTALVQLDSIDLRKGFESHQAGKIGGQKPLLEALGSQISGPAGDVVTSLVAVEKKVRVRAKEGELSKFAQRDMLVKLGFLKQDDIRDNSKLLEAKTELMAILKADKPSMSDLVDDEYIEGLKKTG